MGCVHFLYLTLSSRFLTGARVLETHIYTPGSYPFDLIAPVSILWRPISTVPIPSPDANPLQEPQPVSQPSKKHKKNNKGKETANESIPQREDSPRAVWVCVHPSVFSNVLAALQASASTTLDTVRSRSNDQMKHIEVELSDLRGQVNIFEVIGPKASQVISGALTPVGGDGREDLKQVRFDENGLYGSCLQLFGSFGCRWPICKLLAQSLVEWLLDPKFTIQGSSEFPIVGCFHIFTVHRFPPKNAKPKVEDMLEVSSPLAVFPTSSLAQCEIWDERTRDTLKRPRYKKKDIDERKSKVQLSRPDSLAI
jgi:ribonuclease P/MRP protein subunit POP1